MQYKPAAWRDAVTCSWFVKARNKLQDYTGFRVYGVKANIGYRMKSGLGFRVNANMQDYMGLRVFMGLKRAIGTFS